MSKNSTRIRAGIRALTCMPFEIMSGTTVSGSIDDAGYTVSVLPSDGSEQIDGVMLSAIAEDGSGVVLYPADESDVVIGSIDGSGEWTLLKTSEILKATVTIGDVKCEIDGTKVLLQNGASVLNMSESLFKINTESESLFALLKDCFSYIAVLTVPTPSGTSSVPVNAADFNNLVTRLNNLLTS